MEQQEHQLAIAERERLLEEAERLARGIRNELERNLRNRSRRRSVDLGKELRSLSGELKRVIEFYQRRLREREEEPHIERQVRELLQAEVPQRGNVPIYWRTLREVLARWLPDSCSRYSHREVLFVLGWAFRLLRSW